MKEILVFQKQLRKQFTVTQAPEQLAIRRRSIWILLVSRAISQPSPGLYRGGRVH